MSKFSEKVRLQREVNYINRQIRKAKELLKLREQVQKRNNILTNLHDKIHSNS